MDPLTSLSQLIRQLVTRTAETSRKASGNKSPPTSGRESGGTRALTPPLPLRERLQARLRAVTTASPDQQRDIFVESVLQHEFGDELLADPALARVTRQVADHLANQPELSARLALLLSELQRPEPR